MKKFERQGTEAEFGGQFKSKKAKETNNIKNVARKYYTGGPIYFCP